MLYQTYYSSPLGEIMLASDGENIIGLWLEGQKYFLGTVNEELIETDDLDVFNITKKWLDQYFNKEQPSINTLPLKPNGTQFRKEVWDILCRIPYGQVITYGDIARELGIKLNKPKMSAQAVGGAVGHNPISIIIPCHRVVGTNGSLTGYAGGIDKKIKLLEIEKVNLNDFFIPNKGTAL
ncbi:MAG: methylated-DNA--[protein]-cysteine S-methyltransferase [Coprobacillus sp.]